MEEKTDTRILFEIHDRLGRIEAKLEAVEEHEPRIVRLEKFEGRVGMYLWLGGGIASGVLFMLWEGIKYIIDFGVGQWLHR